MSISLQQHPLFSQDMVVFPVNIRILWHIDPMLSNDRETNNTTAAARQRPAHNNGNTVGSGVFYVVRYEAVS
jgi:hypothetical protein